MLIFSRGLNQMEETMIYNLEAALPKDSLL